MKERELQTPGESPGTSQGDWLCLPFKTEIEVVLCFRTNILPELLRGHAGPRGVISISKVPVFPFLILFLGDQLISWKVGNGIWKGA